MAKRLHKSNGISKKKVKVITHLTFLNTQQTQFVYKLSVSVCFYSMAWADMCVNEGHNVYPGKSQEKFGYVMPCLEVVYLVRIVLFILICTVEFKAKWLIPNNNRAGTMHSSYC